MALFQQNNLCWQIFLRASEKNKRSDQFINFYLFKKIDVMEQFGHRIRFQNVEIHKNVMV